MIARTVTQLLSPAGTRARLTVLLYHRVLPEPDPRVPAMPWADRFAREMRWFAEQFQVLAPSDAVARLKNGSLPARAGVITFDDGFLDNLTIAAPILCELGLPAAFFVSTAYLDGAIPFFETAIDVVHGHKGRSIDLRRWGIGILATQTMAQRRRASEQLAQWLKYQPNGVATDIIHDIAAGFGVVPPTGLMMNRSQMRALRDTGMEIGGHSHEHVILTTMSEDDARAQLVRNHQELTDTLGAAPKLFAYPNGKPGRDFNQFHMQVVRSLGYDAAFSSVPGTSGADCDPLCLPRFGPWGTKAMRFKYHLLRNLRHG